jgi:hypothetical protein
MFNSLKTGLRKVLLFTPLIKQSILFCIFSTLLLLSPSQKKSNHNLLKTEIWQSIYSLWSSGQSSWLQIQRSGFAFRRYKIF